ncbi:unnamed protein product, partial [Rotaria magnacalcarata]
WQSPLGDIVVQNDNIIPASYFNSAFPGAIGLMFTDESLNGVVIIPKDNIAALNLTSSTESKKKTLFNWLGSAGIINWFKSSESNDGKKKQ